MRLVQARSQGGQGGPGNIRPPPPLEILATDFCQPFTSAFVLFETLENELAPPPSQSASLATDLVWLHRSVNKLHVTCR